MKREDMARGHLHSYATGEEEAATTRKALGIWPGWRQQVSVASRIAGHVKQDEFPVQKGLKGLDDFRGLKTLAKVEIRPALQIQIPLIAKIRIEFPGFFTIML